VEHDCCASAQPVNNGRADSLAANGGGPLVEILYFDGCPNHEGALELVRRVATDLRLQPDIRLVNVPDPEAAARLRFLGSPTVRVGGRDVEPGVEDRTDYALSCRVFRTERGFAGQPDERWVRDAFLREAGVAA
jgi:hypothetical protein